MFNFSILFWKLVELTFCEYARDKCPGDCVLVVVMMHMQRCVSISDDDDDRHHGDEGRTVCNAIYCNIKSCSCSWPGQPSNSTKQNI